MSCSCKWITEREVVKVREFSTVTQLCPAMYFSTLRACGGVEAPVWKFPDFKIFFLLWISLKSLLSVFSRVVFGTENLNMRKRIATHRPYNSPSCMITTPWLLRLIVGCLFWRYHHHQLYQIMAAFQTSSKDCGDIILILGDTRET